MKKTTIKFKNSYDETKVKNMQLETEIKNLSTQLKRKENEKN